MLVRLQRQHSSPPRKPFCYFPPLLPAMTNLPISGMTNVTTITLHESVCSWCPLSEHLVECHDDPSFIMLRSCFPRLQDLRVFSAVPTPRGRRYRVTNKKVDGGTSCVFSEWYSGRLTFQYDRVTRERELSEVVEEGTTRWPEGKPRGVADDIDALLDEP